MARWYLDEDVANEETTMKCSNCKAEFVLWGVKFDISVWHHCPKCGEPMEEGEKDG